MLSQEQIDINIDVQNAKQDFSEQGELIANLIIDEHYHGVSDIYFVVEHIKKHKNLLLMLDILDQKIEFFINCVFLYRITLKEYLYQSIDPDIAEEITKRDIIELFEYYNIIPIHDRKVSID